MNLTENAAGRIASFVDFDWGAHLNPWFGATKEDAEDPTIFATVYEDAKHLKVHFPKPVLSLSEQSGSLLCYAFTPFPQPQRPGAQSLSA